MEPGRTPNNLRKYRRMIGLSQKQVAKVIGIKYSRYISNWENGSREPKMEYLFKLSSLYKTMPNHLYFDYWQSVKKDCVDREAELLATLEPN